MGPAHEIAVAHADAMLKVQILPSILACDLGRLAEECRRAEQAGADGLHVDVMDGHFVPNLSVGPAVVTAARKATRLPLNVHLMISNPDEMTDAFLDAGADTLLIHIEVACDVVSILESIRRRGVRPGITLNPETPAEAIRPVLSHADEVLCMTVHPGFGGQTFIPNVLPKLEAIRRWAPDVGISVDGGVDLATAPLAAAHGANIFVAGTSLFGAADMAQDIRQMRDRARTALARSAAIEPRMDANSGP